MNIHKSKSLAVLLAIFLSALTGCGAAPAQEAGNAASAVSAGAGSSNAAVQPQKITVAVASNSKPVSYTGTDGKLTGYEVDILRAIDDAVPEYELNIESVSQSAEEVGIDTGKYALIAQGAFKTADRAKKYLIPDENTGLSLIKIYTLKEKTDIKTLADLKGKKLAPVPPNGGIYNMLTAYNKDHPDTAVQFTTAENVPIANRFKELQDRKYDAVVWPSSNLDLPAIEKSLGTSFGASDPVQINPTYLLIAKSQTDFYDKVNAAIKKLKQDGTLTKLSQQYFGENVFDYQK